MRKSRSVSTLSGRPARVSAASLTHKPSDKQPPPHSRRRRIQNLSNADGHTSVTLFDRMCWNFKVLMLKNQQTEVRLNKNQTNYWRNKHSQQRIRWQEAASAQTERSEKKIMVSAVCVTVASKAVGRIWPSGKQKFHWMLLIRDSNWATHDCLYRNWRRSANVGFILSLEERFLDSEVKMSVSDL